MTKYIEVAPDLDKWQEFVWLALNEIYGPEQITVYYDEAAPELPTEVMLVTADGSSQSTYLSPDTINDFRMDMYSRNEAYGVANNEWRQ